MSLTLLSIVWRKTSRLLFSVAETNLSKHSGWYNSITAADLDNDGDMDLIVNNTNDYASIFKNNSELITRNNYIKIKLKGSSKNTWGIGAKVIVYYKDKGLARGLI